MDDPFEIDAPKVVQPPKKRSLFSSKAIGKSAGPDDGLFFRAKEVHPQILAEEERKRQKKILKLERKRSSTSADVKELTPPEEKRRRVAAQAKDQDGYSSDESRSPHVEPSSRARRLSSHSSPSSQRSRKGSSSHNPHSSPTSLSARYSKEVTENKQISPRAGRSTGCITLSDSEDESPTKSLPVRMPAQRPISVMDSDDDIPQHRKFAKPIPEEENQFSDEEYPELVAAAKERARLKAAETSRSAKVFRNQNHTAETTQDLDDIFAIGSGLANADPSVEILITSVIDGTTPLRVRRRISQKLAEVRLAWCDRQRLDGQPMGPEFTETVFLTWKHIRLFDFSTCNGLGLKVNEFGSLVSTSDGIDPDGRVHLEAWTPDAFKNFQKVEAAKKKEQEQSAGDEVEQHREPAVKKTRLIFKSRDLPDYKLSVKSSTTVERMVEAFREANEVPDHKLITMHFDGDKLEYSDKVEDTELGDMDTVEVHIR